MSDNANQFHDELYREHAAALEAFMEARRAWQDFFEGLSERIRKSSERAPVVHSCPEDGWW